MQTSQILKQIDDNRNNHEFISTGFPILDQKLDGGFLRKELVVLGGSTGVGKSYMAIHMAMQAASAGFRTGYFSLEISNELVIARMIGMRAGVKAAHILYGMVEAGHIDYIKAVAFVDGLTNFNSYDDVYELEKIAEIVRRDKLEYVVIDFIQNVFATRTDEYERLSLVSLSLQRLAKATNSCILVLSQLSNEVSRSKAEDRPLEYKGSGSIATVADLGFFLKKVDVPEELKLTNSDSYELTLAKNRRGPSKLNTLLQVTWPGGAFYEQRINTQTVANKG